MYESVRLGEAIQNHSPMRSQVSNDQLTKIPIASDHNLILTNRVCKDLVIRGARSKDMSNQFRGMAVGSAYRLQSTVSTLIQQKSHT